MFCTHCGTQIDEGKNFCRNCGARIARPDAAPAPNPARSEPAGSQPPPFAERAAWVPAARERQGLGAAAIVGACVILILAAGAGLYFGTDLLRPSAKPQAPETVAPAGAASAPAQSDAPADALWEEAKNSAGGAAPAPQPQAEPAPAEPAPPPENSSRSASRADAPAPRRSQDAPAPARASRPPETAPASRRGAAGIYETVRATDVFQSPSASAPVVANIPGGTRVNVVASSGEWLEVHSRRGNPPGFIRRDDALFVARGE